MTKTSDLATATDKGDITYALPLELPPALLQPTVTLNYSSEGNMDMEMPYGWSLGGITEIRRPLSSYYDLKEKNEWGNAEWIVNGPSFSGTLIPSGNNDNHFTLKASTSTYVTAEYLPKTNSWTIQSGGITYQLSATDQGASTKFGTERWRVFETKDTSDNYITYCYDDSGRINNIAYGGNSKTNTDHLITVAFAYGDNVVARTNARAGFIKVFDKHIEKITVKSGWQGMCDQKSSSNNTWTPGSSNSAKQSGKQEKSSPLESGKFAKTIQANSSKQAKVTSFSKHNKPAVTAVHIKDADDDEDSNNRLYAYDIVTTEVDTLNLLLRLEREGKTSSKYEVLAQFSYTAFDASESATSSSSDVPASLGYAISSTSTSGMTQTDTTKALQDINRDGLPDVVETADKDMAISKTWQVTSQGVNHKRRSFFWNSPEQINSDGGSLATSIVQKNNENGLPYNISYTTRQLVDFDGDGYLDYLVSGDPAEWTVYYGTGGGSDVLAHSALSGVSKEKKTGNDFEAFTETPPSDTEETWTYAQASWRLDANADGAASVTTDVPYGTMDFNGDGWLDLVNPSTQKVWLHSGIRGGGWNQELTLTPSLDAMRKVHYTLKQRPTSIQVDANDFCKALEAAVLQAPGGDAEDNTGFGITSYDDPSCLEAVSQFNQETKMSIAYTDETGGFYDLNGDGLPDYVVATSATWLVYLNTGNDLGVPGETPGYILWSAPVPYTQRADEGSPFIMWQDNQSSTDVSKNGTTAVVYQKLMDVDADGLLDLAMSDHENLALKNVWYKNTGAGFEDTPRDLPLWYARSLNATIAFTNVVNDAGNNTGNSATTTVNSMLDINHDGVVDLVSTEWKDEEGNVEGEETNNITYGPYPPPYLLKTVDNNQGGQTAILYRSLATVAPSGDWSELQYTPNEKHLVDTIESLDGITAASSTLTFDYNNGRFDHGVFMGFLGRTQTVSLDGTLKGKTEYNYTLIEDLEPIITTQTLYNASTISTGTGKNSTTTGFKKQYAIDTTYQYQQGSGANFYLPQQRTITEYGGLSGSATSVIDFAWDDFGNMLSYKHNGGGDSSLAINVEFDYVSDDDNSFFRIAQQSTSGTNPVSGVNDVLARTIYYYDDHTGASESLSKGLLTREDKHAGWIDGGESLNNSLLSIEYGRGDRGELISILDVATGQKINQTFGFGGAVLETQTNALGNKLLRSIDEQGRITSIKDDNGLMLKTTYDDFSHEIKKEVTGKDGKTYTLKENEYTRSSWPYYSQQKIYNGDGSVDFTSYIVENGFGNMAQKWTQGDNGKYLIKTEFHNLQGLLTKTSHPRVAGSSFQVPQATLSTTNPMTQSSYDVFGKITSHEKDTTFGTGTQTHTYGQPRQEIFTDEEGYQMRVTRDAYGRAIKVERGKSGSYSLLASYAYDPTNNLVSFTDGEGIGYTYSYDGASRLRSVKWSALSGNSNWYEYTYQGTQKTRMQDASGAYTTWEYDAIGRIKTMTVSDSLPDSPTGTLTYEYFYDDKWIGALSRTTDPSGITEYIYDDYGRPSQISRTYNTVDVSETESLKADFTYVRDLRGRILSKTYPSGRMLTMDYDYGFLKKIVSTKSGETDYSLSCDYNKWGLLEKATSSHGHIFTNTYSTPLWTDAVNMTYGDTTYSRTYTWLKNGLLKKYKIDVGKTSGSDLDLDFNKTKAKIMSLASAATQKTGAITSKAKTTDSPASGDSGALIAGISTDVTSMNDVYYNYAYDNLKQVIKLTKDAMSNVTTQLVEEYAYNTSGNITTSQDNNGKKWTYSYDPGKNMIVSRTSSEGDNEEFTYDAAGRIKTWRSIDGNFTYYYDGQGRLRGVVEGATWKLVLDYDANNALVRRADSNPYTSSPYYVYSFDNWRYNDKNKKVTELDNVFVSIEDETQKWTLNNYDGQVARVFDQGGNTLFERISGLYGSDLSASGETWNWSAYHGHEKQENLFHVGQRHLIQGFGHWLQPEPLLYQGLSGDTLGTPLKFSAFRYAANSPTQYQDADGANPIALVPIAVAVIEFGPVVLSGSVVVADLITGADDATIKSDMEALSVDVGLMAVPGSGALKTTVKYGKMAHTAYAYNHLAHRVHEMGEHDPIYGIQTGPAGWNEAQWSAHYEAQVRTQVEADRQSSEGAIAGNPVAEEDRGHIAIDAGTYVDEHGQTRISPEFAQQTELIDGLQVKTPE